jgi:hypothetical protein
MPFNNPLLYQAISMADWWTLVRLFGHSIFWNIMHRDSSSTNEVSKVSVTVFHSVWILVCTIDCDGCAHDPSVCSRTYYNAEDWTNTIPKKALANSIAIDGANQPNNVSRKLSIVTKLNSLVQQLIKLTTRTFLTYSTYLHRRGVHMNVAQY